jgi:hypothetical protein
MALTKTDKEWINLVLAPIKQDIAAIKKTTAETNGKVVKHESQITQALEERKNNREKQDVYFNHVDELSTRTELLEKADIARIINCPVSPKLRTVEDQMVGFMAEIKTRTKIFSKTSQIVILVIMATTLFLGVYNTVVTHKATEKQAKNISVKK